MTPQTLKALDRRLQHFLEDLTEPMGRSERRHWARIYLQGLLLDGERKSIEPMASRMEGADVQALRQFLGQSPWEVAEIERRLADKVLDLLSEPEVWIIDETAFPKAGKHSVGVARQYCGTLGKVANCQVAVSLHWATAEASCPILWRLYLPKEWLEDRERAAEVKLPPETPYRTKTELALEVIDQALETAEIYLVFGGPLTAFVLACIVAALSLFALRGVRPWVKVAKRVALFGTILFAYGIPADVLYTLVMRERFYTDNDPLVDWLPWLPSGLHTIDFACQGRYLNGASAWTLNVAWTLLAIPVWVLTYWTSRHIWSIGSVRQPSGAVVAAQHRDAADKP